MDNKYFGNIEIFSKAAVDSTTELGKINTKVIEKLTQKNMELFNATVEASNKWVSILGATKGYKDIASEQLKLANEYNGKVVQTVKDATQVLVDSRDEYQSWFEDGVKIADEVLKTSIPSQAA